MRDLLRDVETRNQLDELVTDIGQLREERERRQEATRSPVYVDPSPKFHRGRPRVQRLAATSEGLRSNARPRLTRINGEHALLPGADLVAQIMPAVDASASKEAYPPLRPPGQKRTRDEGMITIEGDRGSGQAPPAKRGRLGGSGRACGICRQVGHTRTTCVQAKAVAVAHGQTRELRQRRK
jgi:hypothetical protein